MVVCSIVLSQDHLVCYLAGTLALGAHNGAPENHLKIAKDLAYTCYQMYERMATGLSPEIVYFNMIPGMGGQDITVKVNFYLLNELYSLVLASRYP